MAKKAKAKDTVKDSFVERINAVTKETANDLYVDLNESELSEAVKQELNIALQAKLNVMEQAELDAAGKPLDEAPVSVPSDESAKPKAKGSLPSWVKAVSATEEQVMKYQEKGRLYGHDPVKGIAYILTTLLMCFALVMPAFAAELTDEAVLGNDRWSVDSSGNLVPNANTYEIGTASKYPGSIWLGGVEYTSFAAGTDGNWTDTGLTVTLDGAPTKFIATKSSGDFFATGFTVGTGDVTFAEGGKIDGDTANEIRLIENSDTLKIGFSGNDITVDTTDGGVIFKLTDATDGTVDFMTNNDVDDYIQISTSGNQSLINFVGQDGKITAASGAISFDDENLSTTGTLGAGATTVTSLIIGDETFSVPADDTIRVASNDAQTIFNVYIAATSNEDAVLLLSADASADNGDDWQIVSDGGTNSLLFQNDATGTQATYLTLSNVGAITTTGDVVIAGTTPMLTIGDAGAEDTAIIFDGDAGGLDWYVASDDSADDLIIGVGATVDTTPAITIYGDTQNVDIETDLTVVGSDLSVGAAGVKLTGDGDGALTLLGLGNGSDEDLTINLDDVANTVGLSSSTGVTVIDAGTINLSSDEVIATQYVRAAYFSVATRPASGAPIGSIITMKNDGDGCGLGDGEVFAVCVSDGSDWIKV